MATVNQKVGAPSAFHIRPARRGDICMLLESTDEAEIAQMRRQQRELQALFGGTPVEPVHLTCQRFEARDRSQLDQFIRNLAEYLRDIPPFSFTALSLQTLYVPALQSNMLKWRVEEIDADANASGLRYFVALAERELAKVGLVSLYAPGAVASLVTALKGVPALTPEDFAQVGGFPYHLFTVNRVVLSRICGPDTFEIVTTFTLM